MNLVLIGFVIQARKEALCPRHTGIGIAEERHLLTRNPQHFHARQCFSQTRIAYAVVVAAVVAVGHHHHMGVQPCMGSRIQHTGSQKQFIVLMGNDHHDFTKICDFHFQLPLHSTGSNTGNNILLHEQIENHQRCNAQHHHREHSRPVGRELTDVAGNFLQDHVIGAAL